jgi:predicted ATPase/DNA-binding SARP family transcriptional activator/Tfp pilus assembly protein PilF
MGTETASARLLLLGRPRLVADPGAAEPAAADHVFAPDKRHRLLAHLAYQGDWVERPRLAALWWADVDDAVAMQNLRQLLRRAKSLAWLEKGPGVEADAHRVRWNVITDVGLLRSALAASDGATVLRVYRGPLMEGLEGYDDSEFTRWLEVEREQLHASVRQAFEAHAEAAIGSGRVEEAVAVVDRLLELDPFDEDAIARRMTLGLETNAPGPALGRFQRFTKRLEREFGLAPSVQTLALAQRLQDAASRHGASVAAVTTPSVSPTSRTPEAGAPRPGAPEAGRPDPGAPPRAPEPPPPRAPEPTPPANLPTPGTTFVGRDLELAEIAARLTPLNGRLVTLIGPSGIGKTRLAVEAARELAPRYPDGATFVPLATVRAVDGLARAMANALGWTLAGHDEPLEELGRRLASRRLLVVLDNFEQLVDEGAPAVAGLLATVAGLDVIVTSHERLGLSEEWVMRVDGLARPVVSGARPAGAAAAPEATATVGHTSNGHPTEWRGADAAEAASSDAVTLFVDRARRGRPDFAATPVELTSVVSICRAVHGSPLGIELAAAWARVLPVDEIAMEIARAPDFLTSSARDVPERHRSMRAAFSYSWSLLTAAEREVLLRLAVFRGGFSRDGAAVVAGANLALLAALVDKALVRASGGRFDVHPLLLGFLGEALAEVPGEPERSRERHARFVLGLVEHEGGRATGPAQVAWLRRLDAERANLDAALDWAVEAGDVELGLRLAAPLLRFWLSRGSLREGRTCVERVLAAGTDARPSLALATALNTAGGLALSLADYPAAEAYYARSRDMARAIDHEPALARVAIGAGLAASRRGDMAAARTHYLEGLALQKRLGNLEASTGILNNLGVLALDLGDAEEAVTWLHEAVAAAQALGDPYYEGSSLNNLGWAAWLRGDAEGARRWLEQGLARCRAAGDVQGSATALNDLALARWRCGDAAGAMAAAKESLELRAAIGDRWGLTYSWDVHAVLAADRGDDDVAARLWSAAEALRTAIGSPLQPGWLMWQAELRDAVRARLGEAAYECAATDGRALDPQAVTTLAKGEG